MVTKKPDPDGYKQTEVGVIPEDWEVDSLKRFWVVTDCKHITAKFVSNGIPVASIREVKSYFVELKNAKQTTELYYLKLIEGGRKPQPKDLIFSRNATVGEVAQVCEWHPPFAMGQDVCLLRKKDPNFSSDYLQAVIRSPVVIEQLANLMVGSTFKRVNVEQIRNLTVTMPLPEEQRAIAQSLSDVDAVITECDRIITKKRNTKQGTMQQLLTGKKRLPGFSGEWEINKLENISSEIGDGIHSTPKYVEFSEFYFINGNNLIKSSIQITDQTKCVSEEEFCKYKNILTDRTILISINGTIGNIAFCNDEKVILGKSAAYINLKKTISKKYIFYFLQTYTINCYFEDELTGSTIRNLSLKSIRNTPVSIPPKIEEQKAIARILSDMDTEIAALEQKRDKYKAIKQGMMQELLTGKTRLISSS